MLSSSKKNQIKKLSRMFLSGQFSQQLVLLAIHYFTNNPSQLFANISCQTLIFLEAFCR